LFEEAELEPVGSAVGAFEITDIGEVSDGSACAAALAFEFEVAFLGVFLAGLFLGELPSPVPGPGLSPLLFLCGSTKGHRRLLDTQEKTASQALTTDGGVVNRPWFCWGLAVDKLVSNGRLNKAKRVFKQVFEKNDSPRTAILT
jgi:hypothetical protein